MITRNESMMASLLNAAIDDGFRLTVKDGKLYMVDMMEPDLGGYPLCFPIEFVGEGFEDLDVVRTPDDTTEPPFRTSMRSFMANLPSQLRLRQLPFH